MRVSVSCISDCSDVASERKLKPTKNISSELLHTLCPLKCLSCLLKYYISGNKLKTAVVGDNIPNTHVHVKKDVALFGDKASSNE